MTGLITILGTGESGMGASRLAHKQGLDVFVSDYGTIDEVNKKELRALGIDFEEDRHTLERILQSDYVVKSPGIPDTVSVIQAIRERNIPVISEIEFACQFIPDSAKIIAITGTNGKTTTTLLTHHLLKSAGYDVALAGNVGHSLAGRVAEHDYDYYVIEVSSFQLDGIQSFRPDISVLLNITPDHLDRYNNDFQAYVNSKFRIVENLSKQECFIYCSDDMNVTREFSQRNIEACLFAISATKPEQEGAFIDNEHLIFDYTYKDSSEQHRIPLSEISLIGKHNMINVMASVLASLLMNTKIEAILKGLRSFKNAPHRLEKVAMINEVQFINDSKATNVDAVQYAIDGIDSPIIWIAGGVDKGNDYSILEDLVKHKVRAIICLGKNNKKLIDAFSPFIGIIEERQRMDDVIKLALEWANTGDVVLLSPACASFDLFTSYIDRGDQFKAAVEAYTKKQQMI